MALSLEGFPPPTGILLKIPGSSGVHARGWGARWGTEQCLPHENLSNPEPDSRATACDEGYLVPERRKQRLFKEAPVKWG